METEAELNPSNRRKATLPYPGLPALNSVLLQYIPRTPQTPIETDLLAAKYDSNQDEFGTEPVKRVVCRPGTLIWPP